MTTRLTETGWVNEDGDFFPWTDNDDVVDEGDDILVEGGKKYRLEFTVTVRSFDYAC